MDGLRGMQTEAGKDQEGSGQDFEQAEIEASGEAILIAEAILAGFGELAAAVRELAKALADEGDEVEPEPERYLDGSKIR